jgi:hypothetical protein
VDDCGLFRHTASLSRVVDLLSLKRLLRVRHATSLKPRAENARGGAEEPKVVGAVVEVAGVDFR